MAGNKFRPSSAGALRHVADIEMLVDGTDDYGTPTTNYQVFAKDVRFDFMDFRVTENLTAKEITSSVLTYLTMRWHPGLTSRMRVKHIIDHSQSPPLADYYDVQGIVRDPTLREFVQLCCIKRDASGYRIGTLDTDAATIDDDTTFIGP